MEICEEVNRNLRPIPDRNRQGETNPRVFLKANVIQASSQLNPDRDKKIWFHDYPLPDPKFGQENFQKSFSFGAH